MKKEVSNKFKYFNFIFTLLIVLYHFRFKTGLNIVPKSGLDKSILSCFLSSLETIGFIAMTVFFMISAFLFYFNIDNSTDSIKKMKKRIKTLLIPFLSWTVISIIFRTIVTHEIKINSLYSIIKYLFLEPADGPLWYILALLIFMIPSPLTIKLKNKKIPSLIVLLAILIIVELREFGYINTFFKLDDWWWHSNMLGYIPAYAIGAFFGLNYSEKIIQEKYNTKHACIFGIIALIISILLIKYGKAYANSKFYLYIILTIGLWFIAKSDLFKKKTPRFMKGTFFMYAMHQPILIPIISKITRIIIKNTNILGYQFILIRVIDVFLILIISWMTSIILKKILPKKLYFALSGGRE